MQIRCQNPACAGARLLVEEVSGQDFTVVARCPKCKQPVRVERHPDHTTEVVTKPA